jgi:hypothetical protein
LTGGSAAASTSVEVVELLKVLDALTDEDDLADEVFTDDEDDFKEEDGLYVVKTALVFVT